MGIRSLLNLWSTNSQPRTKLTSEEKLFFPTPFTSSNTTTTTTTNTTTTTTTTQTKKMSSLEEMLSKVDLDTEDPRGLLVGVGFFKTYCYMSSMCEQPILQYTDCFMDCLSRSKGNMGNEVFFFFFFFFFFSCLFFLLSSFFFLLSSSPSSSSFSFSFSFLLLGHDNLFK